MSNVNLVKVAIAAEWIKKGPKTNKSKFSQKYGISTPTLSRYISVYEKEAQALIHYEEIGALALAEAEKDIGDSKYEPTKVHHVSTSKRNGRWEMLNRVFSEVGLDLPTKKLFEVVNDESVRAGLPKLKKSTFYSMVSVARKAAGVPAVYKH